MYLNCADLLKSIKWLNTTRGRVVFRRKEYIWAPCCCRWWDQQTDCGEVAGLPVFRASALLRFGVPVALRTVRSTVCALTINS